MFSLNNPEHWMRVALGISSFALAGFGVHFATSILDDVINGVPEGLSTAALISRESIFATFVTLFFGTSYVASSIATMDYKKYQ